MVSERQALILEQIIKNYIDTHEPIGSEFLSKHLKDKFGIELSAPLIRKEMQTLTEKKFIAQPYTSGGRIPTKKGYELFVKKKIDDIVELEDDATCRKIKKIIEEFEDNKKELAKEISRLTSFLTILYDSREKYVYEGSWEGILEKPETENPSYMKEFISAVKRIEEDVEEILNGIEEMPTFIIGGDISKKIQAKGISVAIAKISSEKDDVVIFSDFLRTDYEKLLKVIKAISYK